MMPFREYLEQVRPTVNRRIEEMAGDGEAVDPGVLPLLLKGKRMRAGLLLRVHTALTRMTVPTPRALDLACALEFAHAASLILDDMLDGDAVRRGAPAHHLTRGEGRAVLDVVGILALPYALAAPYGSQYVTMLASAQQSMTRGVAWEVLEQPLLPSVELYDAVITRKTGCLFSLAAAWGAMTAGADENVVTAFANFGLSAGKAMQIADDIADLHVPGDCRPGSEALLLQSIFPGDDGAGRALASLLDAEIASAAARLRLLAPREQRTFIQAVRDIVGITIAGPRIDKYRPAPNSS